MRTASSVAGCSEPAYAGSGGGNQICAHQHKPFDFLVKQSATLSIVGVSGQRPEQGATAKFIALAKTWAQGPYPAHRSFKCSQAAVALIRLSTFVLPVVGVTVDSYVDYINHRSGFVC
ncbi:MAG: hypothetical protein RLZZ591_1932 [Pseudomonadota bacterium]|jgi:hypothetical protein